MLTTMLEYVRFALYATLVVILLMLYQTWDKEHPKAVVSTPTVATSTGTYIPEVSAPAQSTPLTAKTSVIATNNPAIPVQRIIHVTSDVFDVSIDALGGNIIELKLLKYPETLHSPQAFVLLNNNPNTRYIAQSGLLSSLGPDTSNGQALYTADKTEYTQGKGQKELQATLTWQNKEGLKVTKIYTFRQDDYEIGLDYKIDNQSNQPWEGNLYLQLLRTNTPPTNGGAGLSNLATYFGAAISSPQKPFEKISFKDMTKQDLNLTATGGWAAMVQHYFVSAWIPDKNMTSQYFSRVTNDGMYTIGLLGPKLTVPAKGNLDVSAKLYSGPTNAERLEKAAPGLQLTVDYGIFWIIAVPIFWLLQHIYNIVGNWGWAIVFVTIIIKLAFFHLSAKSYRSMSALKKLQPKITALRERFGEDRQKLTQATMELYKKEKVNPMSGCLPILIQIPVFIALYWVLVESVELRQAPFILWIHDLSVKDPWYILPLLMGASMFLQQLLSPPPPDPMQAKVMMMMPVIFTVLFINFPAGLMLYWFVNNTLSVLQQWYIMRSLEKDEKTKTIKT